jgi:hypothetical protein
MKTTHLLAILVAATLPLAAIAAEESGKTEATDQNQTQSSDITAMKTMSKGQVMSNWKDQDVELDKLVAVMNDAPAEKKLEAVAAVLTKLVEQRKAMHEQMQKMMSANEKEGMGMCRLQPLQQHVRNSCYQVKAKRRLFFCFLSQVARPTTPFRSAAWFQYPEP